MLLNVSQPAWIQIGPVPHYNYFLPIPKNPSSTTSSANPRRPAPSAEPCNSDLPQAANRTVLERIRHRMNASNPNTRIGAATDGTGPTTTVEEDDGTGHWELLH